MTNHEVNFESYFDPPDYPDPPPHPRCKVCGRFLTLKPLAEFSYKEKIREDVDLDKARRNGYNILEEYPEYNIAVCEVEQTVYVEVRKCTKNHLNIVEYA